MDNSTEHTENINLTLDTGLANSVKEWTQQLLEAAQEVIKNYGPDAVELSLNVLRIDALSQLFAPFVLAVFSIFLLKYLWAVSLSWEQPIIFPLGILSVVVVAILITCVIKLLNIWLWVGLIYPEMYAVYKFIL